ncbi:hypothetical protein; putative membrane protein [Acinetobacter baylyi ADP1]|uniref:Uncharacterized protein n=2 Tax=Acinetobacter baylyi TaxID=202950 RepID=Q6FBF3_ACIAD|nr:hypothetical protein; putative membrane protein [Acinetobacter baylyi ADP1]
MDVEMNEVVGMIFFYFVVVLGGWVLATGVIHSDFLLMVISFILFFCAFLIKLEFKLNIIFWKNS